MVKQNIQTPKIDLFNPNKIIDKKAFNQAFDDGKLDFLLDKESQKRLKKLRKELAK